MRQYVVTVGGREYDVDAPDERTAWAWANAYHAKQMQQRDAILKAEAAKERERFKAQEASRPLLQRALVNIGAGLDTAWQGAKQLVGAGGSDEEIVESRRLKAGAAETMPGGGLLQIVGEVVPTLAVPAGGFAAGLRGLGLLKKASRLKTAIADASVAGGVAGALVPTTESESRALNVALGAAGGAAVPAAIGGGHHLVKSLTQRGAQERAAGKLVEQLGGARGAQNAIADIQTYYPKGAEDIPLSTAAITGRPELAMLERASRGRDPASWMALDAETNRAVWRNIERATANADDLDRLRELRQQNWLARQEEAVRALRPRKFAKEVEAFRENIEQALKSPAGQNQMRPVLMEIRRQLDELGPNLTPEHLMTLRANMQGAIKGTPDNPFATAPRTDPYYISLKQELDRILNEVTKGKWQKVVEGYAKESVPVQAAKSSKAIREAFVTPEGVLRTGELAGAPKVTEARLRQALAAKGESKFGDALAPESRQRLEATLRALNRQNITQTVKTSGTGGGGSNTLMDLMAQQIDRRAASAIPVLGPLITAARNRGDELLQREIDTLLRNPDEFVRTVRAALDAGRPLPRAQAEILAVLQRAPGASLPVLLSE